MVLTRGFSSSLKVLYDPQAFFTHAALLDQACAHCPIFPTAASRRSLGRVSVPVWLSVLSDQLLIVALVSRYLTNKLIRHRLIHQREVRRSPAFSRRTYAVLARVSPGYPPLKGRFLCITHPSATRRPEIHPERIISVVTVRLACVRHAASVQSEPGSNSSVEKFFVVRRRRNCRGTSQSSQGKPPTRPGHAYGWYQPDHRRKHPHRLFNAGCYCCYRTISARETAPEQTDNPTRKNSHSQTAEITQPPRGAGTGAGTAWQTQA